MNYKNLFYGICTLVIAISLFDNDEVVREKQQYEQLGEVNIASPACLRMYDAIHKYAEIYQVPKNYAFGIAYKETTYRGPFDWKYNHKRTSCVGAIGPMQIMPSTADLVWKKPISKKYLMENIEFNVHTSMKLLNKLYKKYGDWKVAFGCYNTGRPMINQYAIDVYNHKPSWNNKLAKLQ